MFLKEGDSKHLVEVLEVKDLFDPFETSVRGRLNYGEEMPEPSGFPKANLVFPSGEALPRCWTDPHYRDEEVRH